MVFDSSVKSAFKKVNFELITDLKEVAKIVESHVYP